MQEFYEVVAQDSVIIQTEVAILIIKGKSEVLLSKEGVTRGIPSSI